MVETCSLTLYNINKTVVLRCRSINCRSKFYYTVSGIITLTGGHPVHGIATYRFDDTRDCIIQFCPPDDEHMCSKHVEA